MHPNEGGAEHVYYMADVEKHVDVHQWRAYAITYGEFDISGHHKDEVIQLTRQNSGWTMEYPTCQAALSESLRLRTPSMVRSLV